MLLTECFLSNQGKAPCLGPLPALGHFVFFKWEENKYFSLYAYCFNFKSDLLNPNFVEKIYILYCFSSKFTISMSKINFWLFGFIETKMLKFENEKWPKAGYLPLNSTIFQIISVNLYIYEVLVNFLYCEWNLLNNGKKSVFIAHLSAAPIMVGPVLRISALPASLVLRRSCTIWAQ